jgi:hypothetical protein
MKHVSAHCGHNVDLLNVKAQWPLYVPFDLTFGMCVCVCVCVCVCFAHRMYLCILCNAENSWQLFPCVTLVLASHLYN